MVWECIIALSLRRALSVSQEARPQNDRLRQRPRSREPLALLPPLAHHCGYGLLVGPRPSRAMRNHALHAELVGHLLLDEVPVQRAVHERRLAARLARCARRRERDDLRERDAGGLGHRAEHVLQAARGEVDDAHREPLCQAEFWASSWGVCKLVN